MSDFLTVHEASKFLGFTESYLRKLCFQRRIPHYKPNRGKLLFDQNELERFVRDKRVLTADELDVLADRREVSR